VALANTLLAGSRIRYSACDPVLCWTTASRVRTSRVERQTASAFDFGYGPRPQEWRFNRARIRMGTRDKVVLLVEDNEDNRIVYSTILQHFGYRVMEALNGEEGIAKARAEKPDLILMDISIPVIDGWEATQVLKRDPETRQIPIIALTAHALASDREKAMEVGCDSYLAKPCEPKAVVSEVERFIGRGDGT
jgi:CheY-like chemotaxis protein